MEEEKNQSLVSKVVIKLTTGWYLLWLIISVLMSWIDCKLIQFLPVSKDKKRKLCCFFTVLWLRLPIYLSPWIRITNLTPKKEWMKMWDPEKKKGGMILVNHTSFFDPFLLVHIMPIMVLINLRTLLKSSLLKIPCFGTVSKLCGHLPVYYNSEKANDFGTDKAAMSAMTQRLTKWLNEGGGVAVWPEGQVSKNPTKLQSFRRGCFKYHLQYKMPLWGLICTGVHHTWPRGVQIGGRPAKIMTKFFKVEEKPDQTDAAVVSTEVQSLMQRELDQLLKKEL